MSGACSSCGGTACPDNFRGLTVHLDNSREPLDGDDLCEKIELCPGNRVYDYELAARWTGDDVPPSVLATWKLGDSEIVLYSLGCTSADLRAVLPGNCLSAFSRICAPPGVDLALVITYGVCLSSGGCKP